MQPTLCGDAMPFLCFATRLMRGMSPVRCSPPDGSRLCKALGGKHGKHFNNVTKHKVGALLFILLLLNESNWNARGALCRHLKNQRQALHLQEPERGLGLAQATAHSESSNDGKCGT